MTLEAAIRWIGLSHLIQPFVTPALSRMLGFGEAFSTLQPVPRQIANNMAVASVALPTSVGVLIAYHAHDIVMAGPARSIAWVAAAFWSWRLYRQCVLGRLWPTTPRTLRWCHWMLTATFAIQGPMLAAILALSSRKVFITQSCSECTPTSIRFAPRTPTPRTRSNTHPWSRGRAATRSADRRR